MSTTPQNTNVWNTPHYQNGLYVDNGPLNVVTSITVGSGTHNYGAINASGTSSFGFAGTPGATYNTTGVNAQVGIEVRGTSPALVFYSENMGTTYLWNNQANRLLLQSPTNEPAAQLSVQGDLSTGGNLSTTGGHIITNANGLYFDKVSGSTFNWRTGGGVTSVATLDDSGNLTITGKFTGDGSGLSNIATLDSNSQIKRQFLPVNALAYGPELTGIARFENGTTTTRGTQATFTRASTANDPNTLGQVATNNPRITQGKYGQGIYIEEGTTNLVQNTEAAVYTITPMLFNHALTSGTGWTTASGSFTYGASGATSAANGSRMYAGAKWTPLEGTSSTSLPLTFQAKFTTPATMPSGAYMDVAFYEDVNDYYTLRYNKVNSKLELAVVTSGNTTVLANVAMTLTTSALYTLQLALDYAGNLTGKVLDYQGNTLNTLTATNTVLSGGYYVSVCADTNVLVATAQLTGPFADGWVVNQSGADYGMVLLAEQLDNKNAIAFNTYNYSNWCIFEGNTFSVASGTQYTLSFWAKADVAGTILVALENASGLNTVLNQNVNLTTSWQYYTFTATAPNNFTDTRVYIKTNNISNDWTYFTAFQVENKGYATTYLQNNSTSSSATRSAENLTYPTPQLGLNDSGPWSISAWAKANINNGTTRMVVGAWTKFYMGISTTNAPILSLQDASGTQHSVYGTTLASPTNWHHWVLTYDGTNVTLYVDGVSVATYASGLPKTMPSTITLGNLGSGYNYYLNGVIDELMFFDVALTSAQVWDIYTNPVPVIDILQTNVNQINGSNLSYTPQPNAVAQYSPNGDLTANTLYAENSLQVQGNGVSLFSGDVNFNNAVYIPSGSLFDGTGHAVTNKKALGAWYDGIAVKGTSNYNGDGNDVFAVVTNDNVSLLNVRDDGSVLVPGSLTISGTTSFMGGIVNNGDFNVQGTHHISFDVMNSTKNAYLGNMTNASGSKVGFFNGSNAPMFFVDYLNTGTYSYHNTLDDGNGNATFTGGVTVNNGNYLTVNGGYIKMNMPSITGGWARGIHYMDPSGSNYQGSMGWYGSASTMSYAYMSATASTSPWTNYGLAVYPNYKVVTKNNTLDDGSGNMTISGTSSFMLASNGVVNNANRPYGALVGYNSGIAVQTKNNSAVDTTPIFGVLTNDSVSYLTVKNGGTVTTLKNTVDDGNGNVTIAGKLTVNGGAGRTYFTSVDGANNLWFAASTTASEPNNLALGWVTDGTGKVTTINLGATSGQAVKTHNNTLDDGAGNATVSGTLTVGSINGVNALSFSDVVGLWHLETSLVSTRGSMLTFTRSGTANNPTTLSILQANQPAYITGKFGNGVSVSADGTTNLVTNSDFETITSIGTIFSNPLTNGGAWTSQYGSGTFGTGGWTSNATQSQITAGNIAWKPWVGSGGQNLAITAQATFAQPATVGEIVVGFYQGSGNWSAVPNYIAYCYGGTFYLAKNGGANALASVAQTLSASTTYTITLSLDINGLLTAKLYSGAGTGGTLLQTLTATDTSNTGGFLIGVGADTNIVISNAVVTGPIADVWGNDATGYALDAGVDGNSAISLYHANSVDTFSARSGNFGVTVSGTYTFSGYVQTKNVVAANNGYGTGGGAQLHLVCIDGSNNTTGEFTIGGIAGTTGWTRYSSTITIPANTVNAYVQLRLSGTGTAWYDAIQVEQKSYASPYQRNDSTTTTATRQSETLNMPTSILNLNEGTIALWINPQYVTSYNNYFNMNISTGRFLLYLNNTGQVLWDYGVANSGLNSASNTTVANQWMHVIMRWSASGGTRELFVNGVKIGSKSFTPPTSLPSTVGIVNNFTSYVDELLIFNRAITDQEAQNIYSTKVPIDDPLRTSVAMVNGVQVVNTDGSMSNNPSLNSFNGTSSGTVYWVQDMQGTFKRVLIYFSNYKNTTATAQTITLPTPFIQFQASTYDGSSGGVASYNLTTITLVANSSTTYNGMVKIEGV